VSEETAGPARGLIALTGATGYVGGRLLRALEARGQRLRCLARRPDALRSRAGAASEIAAADCLDPGSLGPALAGVETAYYLVHSMGSGADFAERDRRAARNFAEAARAAGVRRIVYLGGLGEPGEPLSPHLRSRHETGALLRSTGVPVVELRASIVIGSGSLSFELIRALVERLPVMLCPRWVRTPAQPIAIEDLLAYLLACLDLPLGEDAVFEVGGRDRVSYEQILREYARQRGLRRWLIPVPLLTPRLSSLWLGLTTPIYARVGRALVEGVCNPTVVRDASAQRFGLEPMGLADAIARAIQNEDRDLSETRWSDALSSGSAPASGAGQRFGTRLIDSRVCRSELPPEQAFAPIRRIGGARGWYHANWLWRLRGALDLLVGGVGMRRGRRDPERLAVGDALDFWRVERFEPDRRLRLCAEMKLPGRAWLEFEVLEVEGGSRLRQTAEFDPRGLLGLLYWYALLPLHAYVFQGMLDAIAAAGRPSARSHAGATRPLPARRSA